MLLLENNMSIEKLSQLHEDLTFQQKRDFFRAKLQKNKNKEVYVNGKRFLDLFFDDLELEGLKIHSHYYFPDLSIKYVVFIEYKDKNNNIHIFGGAETSWKRALDKAKDKFFVNKRKIDTSSLKIAA